MEPQPPAGLSLRPRGARRSGSARRNRLWEDSLKLRESCQLLKQPPPGAPGLRRLDADYLYVRIVGILRSQATRFLRAVRINAELLDGSRLLIPGGFELVVHDIWFHRSVSRLPPPPLTFRTPSPPVPHLLSPNARPQCSRGPRTRREAREHPRFRASRAPEHRPLRPRSEGVDSR